MKTERAERIERGARTLVHYFETQEKTKRAVEKLKAWKQDRRLEMALLSKAEGERLEKLIKEITNEAKN